VRKHLEHLLKKQYVYGYMMFFNMNICRNNTLDIRQLTEYAHDHVVDVAIPFACSPRLVRPVRDDQHRAGGLAHHSIGHRPQHQPVIPSQAVSSHDDDVCFPRLRKRQNRVWGYSLVCNELRLNFIVVIVLHEFPQLLHASLANSLAELLIECHRGCKARGRMLP
jgi:hypothetical protein